MWNNLAFEEQSNCLIVKCTGLLKICFDASDLNHEGTFFNYVDKIYAFLTTYPPYVGIF